MIFFKLKQINKRKEKGFTLVEALIAVTILMMSVTAPLKLAGDGINATIIAEQQIIAFYLTQDAMEYVRGLKTGNRLGNTDILNGLNNCNLTVSSDGCRIDTLSGSILQCSNSQCSNGKLRFHNSTGVYDYNSVGSTDSIYTRQIKITPRRLDGITARTIDALVEVSTSWAGPKGDIQVYNLKANMLDW